MIILSGASACGKTEVAKYLESHYGFQRVITTTTRNMRVGETNGVDYHFVNIDTFNKYIDENHFVEYMEYNGNLYGSTIDEIKDNKILVCDSKGVIAYKKLNNPRIVIFILETNESVRFNRMLSRGDKEANAKSRLEQDKITFSTECLGEGHYHIDTTNIPVKKVAEIIINKYNEILK